MSAESVGRSLRGMLKTAIRFQIDVGETGGGLLEGGGKLASLKRRSLENIFHRDGIFLGGSAPEG